MTQTPEDRSKWFRLSIDWWAVLTALAFAVVVKLGLIHKVPW